MLQMVDDVRDITMLKRLIDQQADILKTLAPKAAGGVTDALRSEYAALAVRASACVECNACLWRCPFEVYIVGKMREAVELFEGDVV